MISSREREEEIEGEGDGVLIVLNGCKSMTMDPRIPTLPERSTSGFTDMEDGGEKREVAEERAGERRGERDISLICIVIQARDKSVRYTQPLCCKWCSFVFVIVIRMLVLFCVVIFCFVLFLFCYNLF